jgi:hypothetical protein
VLEFAAAGVFESIPHVRQAFYEPCGTFLPVSVNLPGARFDCVIMSSMLTDPPDIP